MGYIKELEEKFYKNAILLSIFSEGCIKVLKLIYLLLIVYNKLKINLLDVEVEVVLSYDS